MNRMRRTIGMAMLVMMVAIGSKAALAQETIEFWFPWPSARPVLEELATTYESRHPGVKINFSESGQRLNQREKLLTSIAAGLPPDIILLVSPITDYILDGMLTPLDPLLAQSDRLRAEDYPPELFEMFKLGGSTYAIPAIEVGPWLGLNYNEYVFEASGLNPQAPASLSALLATHNRLTRIGADGNVTQLGIHPVAGHPANYFANLWPAVYDQVLYDPDSRTITVNTPGMRDLFEYLNSFFEVASVDAVNTFRGQLGGLANGRLAMEIGGYWRAGDLRRVESFTYGHGWMPNARGDHMMVVGGWGAAIPKGAEHVEEAFEVIEFYTSPEAAQVIFAERGWLNGNLAAMRSLDISDNPKISFFIESLAAADRIAFPEPIPVMLDVRNVLRQAAYGMVEGEAPAEQLLANAERELQGIVDDTFAAE